MRQLHHDCFAATAHLDRPNGLLILEEQILLALGDGELGQQLYKRFLSAQERSKCFLTTDWHFDLERNACCIRERRSFQGGWSRQVL